jgi:hypothetical protein
MAADRILMLFAALSIISLFIGYGLFLMISDAHDFIKAAKIESLF